MYNWREINKEICSEWDRLFQGIQSESDMLRTAERRDALLQTFNAVMDIAETTVVPDDLEVMKNARDKQYKTFIFQEAMVGESVCVETLQAITQREIDAGRMTVDHSCRRIAEDAMAAPHLTRAQLLAMKEEPQPPTASPHPSLGQKVARWFKR